MHSMREEFLKLCACMEVNYWQKEYMEIRNLMWMSLTDIGGQWHMMGHVHVRSQKREMLKFSGNGIGGDAHLAIRTALTW